MLTRRLILAGGAGAALMAAHRGLAAPVAAPVSPEQLVGALETAIAQGTPGLSAAIGTRRGVVWTGVAGMADISANLPIDEGHCFGVGSITKMFVAVTILQLVEEGRLALTATPRRILGSQMVQGIANADIATVAHLLAHTAGVPSWEDDPAWIRKGRGDALDPAHLWGKSEALEFIRGQAALNVPGAKFSYSNSGFTLLGQIIEKVTGRTAEAEIRRRILAPLALGCWLEGFEPGHPERLPNRYHYATPTFRQDAGIAPGFDSVRPELIDASASNLSVEWTAGGMISSPTDLVRFATALRDGRLLKPGSLAFMRTWGEARPNTRMGHSLFQFRNNGNPLDGHNGSVLGFTGSLWWSEAGDAVVAVLANVGSMHSGKIPPAAYDVAQRSVFTTLALDYASQHGVTK